MTTVTVPLDSTLAEGIYLARQSILDRNQALFAFELLFRSSDSDSASFTDGTLATATVIQHVLHEFGLESVLGQFKGFINVDAAMIMSDMVELLPRDRVVLEVLETVELNPRIVGRLEELKRAGFSLALDDVVELAPEVATALGIFDVLKIDVKALGMNGANALLKQEPMLTMNLLRLTNSVGTGMRTRIASVSSALMVLGRRQLLRWLQLILFAGNKATARQPTPLMQLAATRGRMMELLAATWHDDGLADRAFMTGIMSLMEALLATPIEAVLAPLPVADDVRSALLERGGRLGAMLDVIDVVEGRDGRDLAAVLARLNPLSTGAVEEAHASALAWANAIAM